MQQQVPSQKIKEALQKKGLSSIKELFVQTREDLLLAGKKLESLRELEFYFRDRNDWPSISGEDYSDLETFFNQDLVCHCYKLSYAHVANLILTQNVQSLEELQTISDAGKQCGQCLRYTPQAAKKRLYFLQHMIQRALVQAKGGSHQLQLSPLKKSFLSSQKRDFSPLGMWDKVERLENVLQKTLRPFLRQDGGDLELVQVGQGEIVLKVSGACENCPELFQGTNHLIEKTLQEILGDSFSEWKLVLLT